MSEAQVFISYSHADADVAWIRAFADSLRSHGVNVWFDECEVTIGESLSDAIEKELRGSDAIVSKGLAPSLLPQPLRTRRFLAQGPPEDIAQELVSGTPALQAS